jgi:hypothetical protein
LDAKFAAECPNPQNSLLISLLPGNLVAETGSIPTASATTQSDPNGRFPVSGKEPAIGGLFGGSNAGESDASELGGPRRLLSPEILAQRRALLIEGAGGFFSN